MAGINIAPVQHIQKVALPDEFYETQAKVVGAIALGKSALSVVDSVLSGSFDPMDNAIVSNVIASGKKMLLDIQTQATTALASVNSMIASISATFTGTATGAAGTIAQINSINSFITVVNNFIGQINNLITQFNTIVNQITRLVERFENIQNEALNAFSGALTDGINDFIDNINDEKEPLQNDILNNISTQMDGLQTAATNVESITTDSWRSHVPPYTVDTYNPDPREPDRENLGLIGQEYLRKEAFAFRGKVLSFL